MDKKVRLVGEVSLDVTGDSITVKSKRLSVLFCSFCSIRNSNKWTKITLLHQSFPHRLCNRSWSLPHSRKHMWLETRPVRVVKDQVCGWKEIVACLKYMCPPSSMWVTSMCNKTGMEQTETKHHFCKLILPTDMNLTDTANMRKCCGEGQLGIHMALQLA